MKPEDVAPYNADFPPVVPVGLDAYRMWERWPQQRIGVRTYMRSTYDRTGHNNTADASHYLYQQAEDFNVTLDVEGQGILYFVRTNHWHGSPWHYEIDGIDHLILESTTANPLEKLPRSVFLPEHLFPTPLTYTYTQTKGADLNWVPMPFSDRLRLAHSRTYYGTGYYIYQQVVRGAALSQPISAWDGTSPPDADVLRLLLRAGEDISPPGGNKHGGRVRVPRGGAVRLAMIREAPATIRRLQFSAPAARAVEFGNIHLRIRWDGRLHASVDAPLALFFGAGTLHNNDGREWLVKALPVSIRFDAGRVVLNCFFPMPFFRSAEIELVSQHDTEPVDDVEWNVTTQPYDAPWNHAGYFHSTYRDHGVPQLGRDLEFLDTRGIEGADEWSGAFVGTSFVFTDHNVLTTLEGDPRFFFDDSQTPQAQGTGTEEWGGGGDYWGGRTMTLPLAGHPVGVVDVAQAKRPDDMIHSAYRYLLADLMPFGKRAVIRFEHGGENESIEHYRSVTLWYGLPSPSLVLTDRFDLGDAASEALHEWTTPDTCPTYEVASRYEWGPDRLPLAIGQPLAEPRDFADYEFEATAGIYELWIETRATEQFFDAAVWPQVNGDISTTKRDDVYMGQMGYLNAGTAPHTYRFNTAAAPRAFVRFGTSGKQRLRIQPRFGRIRMGRILLSPERKTRPPFELDPTPDEIVLPPSRVTKKNGAFQLIDDPAAFEGKALVLGQAPEDFEVYPAQRMTGRCIDTRCEFTLAIRADNHGVMIRRTLDYRYPNQRACVSIHTGSGWTNAGVWYLAGSNTVYHSFPRVEGELGAARPVVITSNRRFRDDEFLLPVDLTRGKDRIRVRIEHSPRNPPLLPGRQPAPTAWTAFGYYAYSWVMPAVKDLT